MYLQKLKTKLLRKHENSKYLVISLFVQLDSGEALDLGVFELVGGGVHLGNHDRLVILVLLAELVIDGSELFAVAAPELVLIYSRVFGVTVNFKYQGA